MAILRNLAVAILERLPSIAAACRYHIPRRQPGPGHPRDQPGM